jgi:acetolactate synthase-1/2/3 large subunit
VTSITNAYLDRTPVLYICGSAGLRDAETNAIQSGFDQVAVATPITKWAHRVTLTQQLPRLVAQAIRVATSAPMGPVLLDVPVDVCTAKVDEDCAPIPDTITLDAQRIPPARAVEDALRLLGTAARPVIMVGVGAYQSNADEELRKFVEQTGIPV